MTNRIFIRAGSLIIMTMLISAINGICAQTEGDFPKGMPKDQKEYYEQLLDISKKYTEARRIKNPIAKKDELDKLTANTKETLNSINRTLSKEGAMNWVGILDRISGGSLVIRSDENKTGRSFVQIMVPTNNLPQDINEVAKKLNKGDHISFGISPSDKMPAVFSGGSLSFQLNIPPRTINSLTIITPK